MTTGQVGDSEIAVDDVTKAEEESAMSCLFVVDKKGDVNQADVADVEVVLPILFIFLFFIFLFLVFLVFQPVDEWAL